MGRFIMRNLVTLNLAASLQDALGNRFNVVHPKMPEADDAGYEAWKAQGRRLV